ncbi:hypothetical protein PSCICJ_04190 [Pseudomonas cichorii]|nr:hypothetical protein PSCICJ_04190 [Pseudomonas cichorii]
MLLQTWIIQIDDRHRHIRQHLCGGLLDQHGQWLAVLKQVRQTLGRVSRIHRHVTRASLEYAQQTDDHFRTTFDTDRYTIVRADALFDQAMSHLVGANIEFAITQQATFKANCRG